MEILSIGVIDEISHIVHSQELNVLLVKNALYHFDIAISYVKSFLKL